MAHNINNNNFMSYRTPAWHKLGVVFDTPLTAIEAGQKIDLPAIHTEPVITAITNQMTDAKAIIGTQRDNRPTVYAVVKTSYQELPHDWFLSAFDQATNHAPIETLGLLGRGDTLFVTTKLPAYDVAGDEIASYLLAYNPLVDGQAATGRVTGVRVVCQNTLDASGRNYQKQFRVIHHKDAKEQLVRQLTAFWSGSVQAAETLKEAYELLAHRRVHDEEVIALTSTLYPTTEPPDLPATDDNLPVLAEWERRNKSQLASRESVYNLFQGDGVGMHTSAALGTAWGAYNAVVEHEDYVKRFRKAESIVFGAGRDRKCQAFDLTLALAKG